MKKLIAIAMFLVACIGTNAQIFVGGSLGFESTKATKDSDSQINWSIVPEIGYKINKSFSVALQLGYSYEYYESGNYIDDNSLDMFLISPYVRYTFGKSGLAKFFVDCGGTISIIGGTYEGYIWGAGLRPGLIIEASEKISLVAKLGYMGYSANSDDLGGGSSFGFGLDNSNFSFGVFYNF